MGDNIGFIVVELLIAVVIIVSLWRVFEKAGQPGWAAIVPIYNGYVLCEIAGKPGWWVVLFFVPIANIVVAILVGLGIAEEFGRGVGFAIGLILLPFIFYPILAFTDNE